MTREIEEKLASSLTAETTEILPYLPYLLQDFWELGSDPAVMTRLIAQYIEITPNTKALDLACGKGAVSVRIAQTLKINVKGIDILPEFIAFAKQKAREFGVAELCEFVEGDINEAVNCERNYDIVIFGAAGIVLGEPAQMLRKLQAVVKPGGYILIDEGYLPEDILQTDVKSACYEFMTEKQWLELFEKTGLQLLETAREKDDEIPASGDSDAGMAFMTARANELTLKYPSKKLIFKDYLRVQRDEYDDINNTLKCVTWILKKL